MGLLLVSHKQMWLRLLHSNTLIYKQCDAFTHMREDIYKNRSYYLNILTVFLSDIHDFNTDLFYLKLNNTK